ncbi:hypothetical protein EVJ58_g8913 [Rhodofomes roseus]|uniref:Uncharacterized protein n=1 Tax=Rhodofomes roseus TaxID=34475 RepID=A0A4Y9XY55_9APHY|nr:hypothetical protein EVJ58_g8913 [Rhodofomes roseus]
MRIVAAAAHTSSSLASKFGFVGGLGTYAFEWRYGPWLVGIGRRHLAVALRGAHIPELPPPSSELDTSSSSSSTLPPPQTNVAPLSPGPLETDAAPHSLTEAGSLEAAAEREDHHGVALRSEADVIPSISSTDPPGFVKPAAFSILEHLQQVQFTCPRPPTNMDPVLPDNDSQTHGRVPDAPTPPLEIPAQLPAHDEAENGDAAQIMSDAPGGDVSPGPTAVPQVSPVASTSAYPQERHEQLGLSDGHWVTPRAELGSFDVRVEPFPRVADTSNPSPTQVGPTHAGDASTPQPNGDATQTTPDAPRRNVSPGLAPVPQVPPAASVATANSSTVTHYTNSLTPS